MCNASSGIGNADDDFVLVNLERHGEHAVCRRVFPGVAQEIRHHLAKPGSVNHTVTTASGNARVDDKSLLAARLLRRGQEKSLPRLAGKWRDGNAQQCAIIRSSTAVRGEPVAAFLSCLL